MAADEKRVFPRRCIEPVPVMLQGESETWVGHVLDYAPAGLSIRVDRSLTSGTRLTVLPQGAGGPVFPVEVKNCHADEGGWRLGCEFLHLQHWDDLRVFGERN
jgi:hypothetical protein